MAVGRRDVQGEGEGIPECNGVGVLASPSWGPRGTGGSAAVESESTVWWGM